MKNKIAIIIPYFGKWPEWIDLYFYSCAQNKSIDFHFFTDCEIPKFHKGNLYFKSISFPDYCAQISLKLQVNFTPESPYKLCDLKPFYGFIHNDILEGYKFFGFGDIDVIWGNIQKFYTDNLLEKYDILSTHADRLSGHFTLIRNTEYYCNLCFQIQDWKSKLAQNKNSVLDEVDFSNLIYPQSKYIKKFYSKIIRKIFNWRNAWIIYYKIMPLLNFLFCKKKMYFKEQFTTPILYNDGLTYKHDSDTWFYENGKIINAKNEKEYIYLHFMIFKKNSFREDHFWSDNLYHLSEKDFNSVRIDRSGFSKK